MPAVTITIDNKTLKAVETEAHLQSRSRSGQIVHIIKQGLREHVRSTDKESPVTEAIGSIGSNIST